MRFAALVIGAALLIGADKDADQSARALLERTKTTTATYASYGWLYQRDDEGNRTDTWALELHRGELYRGEGIKVRTLVNCRTHVGWLYDIASDTLTRNDEIWVGACGIFSGGQIIAVDLLAPINDRRFGRLDVLRVTDRRNLRYYAIDRRGVIIRSAWAAANGSPAPCIQQEPIAILQKLPADTLFMPEALKHSLVPERYRAAPKAVPPLALSGRRCGD